MSVFFAKLMELSTSFFNQLSSIHIRTWITLAVIVLLCIIGLVIQHSQPTQSIELNIKKLVYGGICISIAFVLSYIRIWKMPQGGSITLASMLPLVLYSMVFGPVAGIIAGIAYGFLQLIQDMWVVNIAQLLLDYPLAFGCLGLAGIVPNKIGNLYIRTGLGILLAMLGRCTMHVLSGVLFFAEYAGDQNPFIYSLVYNGSFLLIETIITLVISFAIISTPIYSMMIKGSKPCYSK